MTDNRGRGPNNESRVERNASRPYENRLGGKGIKDTQKATNKKVDDILNKK